MLTLYVFVFGWGTDLWAQTDPEQQARKQFDAGLYDQAYLVFSDLVRLYPDDKSLNYYFGASAVESGQYTEGARQALLLAQDEQPNAFYYLGQYYQAQGNWSNALKNYSTFKNLAKKKDVNASRVNELMSMSRNRINPFQKAVSEEPVKTELPQVAGLAAEPVVTVENVPLVVPDALKDSLIHFQVNARINYMKLDHFKHESSKLAFINGWLLERELQSKMDEMKNLRGQYAAAPVSMREELADRILALEQDTYRMNQQVRNAYLEANEKEFLYWNQAGEPEISEFTDEIGQLKDSIRAKTETGKQEEMLPAGPVVAPDTVVVVIENQLPAEPTNQIVYKIQIGAYRGTPPEWVQRMFRKLSVIRRIDQYTDEKGVTVYTVGEMKSYRDAQQMQSQVKMEGVNDAVIAAYRNNERINVNEARKLTD